MIFHRCAEDLLRSIAPYEDFSGVRLALDMEFSPDPVGRIVVVMPKDKHRITFLYEETNPRDLHGIAILSEEGIELLEEKNIRGLFFWTIKAALECVERSRL